jgi:tol-pal system protein YbgF
MGAESARGTGLHSVTRRGFGLTAACFAVFAAGCASTPPEADPVQIKLNDLDTRLARIERVMSNQSLLDLANQGEALRSDLRAMHNDVDQLNNSLEASRKQQRGLYADLDRRMKSLELRGAAGTGAGALAGAAAGAAGAAGAAAATGAAGGAGAADVAGGAAAGGAAAAGAAAAATGAAAAGSGDSGAAGGAGDSSSSVPDDRAVYQTAFGLLKDGQYDRAITAFQKFLAAYPESQLADNAQYWLGEAHYVEKSFPEAQAAFQRVVDKYPQSRKRPDALLKIGYCEYELKQWDSAIGTLSEVASKFADTPAGHLAQQRLDRMATEQH